MLIKNEDSPQTPYIYVKEKQLFKEHPNKFPAKYNLMHDFKFIIVKYKS